MNVTETTRLNPFGEKAQYPEPLTFDWRLKHSIAYCIGGFTFAVGSAQYFPSISNFVLGGWLFTIGSAAFLFADIFEWWKNNRVGCFMYDEYEYDFEQQNGYRFESKNTFQGKLQRAVNGLNFFYSAIGSFLYLVGSILFIPSLNSIPQGTEVFIYGSFIIFTSQSWKIYRAGCNHEGMPLHNEFSLYNAIFADFPAFGVDFGAGAGGLCYFIGSIYFLPQYDLTDADTTRAAIWFQCGGIFFAMSGLFMLYRYFVVMRHHN
jgi:hypothetical protein